MDKQLEQIRDIWMNAFFAGDYEVLRQYESEHFKVIYEQQDRVESNYTRYDLIAHAVQNGVWKPQKPNIELEEYSFNEDQTQCEITITLADSKQKIRELWDYKNEWKINKLRFLKS
ncbi:hypothetical protein A3K93_12655 [Acinetobacter sp. NCu2D-2]|uniref:hypothetical protein n=1 Tax=Acinetobacter sp. NCu2D-2 TaxID=1608473 RepID=UPI0007CDFC05|nr:hypothetical protein [Acinetobacter sp. NCu2D-2]ANF82955.1 hypothetical protein A3K93_12655 [Acinetobacter sp. NCu2D-2]